MVAATIAIVGGLAAAFAVLFALGYLDQIKGSYMGPWFEVRELARGFRGLESARPMPTLHRILIYVAAACPLPLAAWTGWASARPPEKVQHLDGRQLVTPAVLAAREKNDIRRTGRGIQLGDFLFSMSREVIHTAIVGGTGSGKTTVIEPLIDQVIHRRDKVFLLDVKGDFTARIGSDPILIAPWDSRSSAWNVGADVTGPAGAAQLAFDLIGEGEGTNAVFRDAARLVLTGILILIMKEKGKKWGWPDLADEIAKIGRDGGATLAERLEKEYPEARGALAEGKARASIIMDLTSKMQIVHQLAAAWRSSKKQFSIRNYIAHESKSAQRIRPVVLQTSETFGHLSRALTSAVIGAIRGAVLSPDLPEVPPNGGASGGSRRTWLILDEIGQIGAGAAEAVVSLAEVGRSKGFRLVIGAQSWSQIEEDLGRDGARSLAAVINTWLIGRQGGGAPGGEKWASEMIGKRRVSRLVGTLSEGGGVTYHRQEEEIQVLRPEFFGQGGKLGADKKGARMILLASDPAVIHVPRGQFTERRPGSSPAPWTRGEDTAQPVNPPRLNGAATPASAAATPIPRVVADTEVEARTSTEAVPVAQIAKQQEPEKRPEIETASSQAIGEIADAIMSEVATGGICTAIQATEEVAGMIENASSAADLVTRALDFDLDTQDPNPAQPITIVQHVQQGGENEPENPLNKLKRRAQAQAREHAIERE